MQARCNPGCSRSYVAHLHHPYRASLAPFEALSEANGVSQEDSMAGPPFFYKTA